MSRLITESATNIAIQKGYTRLRHGRTVIVGKKSVWCMAFESPNKSGLFYIGWNPSGGSGQTGDWLMFNALRPIPNHVTIQ